MKHDIKDKQDIALLVNTFYDTIRGDEILGPIFNDVAKVNWERHIPLLIEFWSTILFSKPGYKGNPMQAHIDLNEIFPLKEEHFHHWRQLFFTTVDDLFEGPAAEHIKQRATHIASLMMYKVLGTAGGFNIRP